MRISTRRVRELRDNQTEAEKTAWYLVRSRRVGARFRRQCRIEKWVIDFYCFERRLAIELDGGAVYRGVPDHPPPYTSRARRLHGNIAENS